MRTYHATRFCNGMDWGKVSVAPIDLQHWLPDAGIRAQAQLCWDETALYIRQCAWEENIRAEHFGQLRPVCEDSCLEFFFGMGDGRYFNIEFNPNKALYFGFGYNGEGRIRLILDSEESLLQPCVAFMDGGWEIQYRVPVTIIRQFYPDFRLFEGMELMGNFYKCGDRTPNPHYLTWNPITSESPSFHRPIDFGRIMLI